MTTTQDYALLSAGAYDDTRFREENRAPIPVGWTELTQYQINGSGSYAINKTTGDLKTSGFSAKVYQNGNEIVIAYAGTEFAIPSAGGNADFLQGNIPLARGSASAQLRDAASLYLRVSADLGSNITFTGHSLGGGLAAIMAVYVDRPAKVFAPAPFLRSVDSAQYQSFTNSLKVDSALADVRRTLRGQILEDPSLGGALTALDSFDPRVNLNQRLQNVKSWAIEGEFLEKAEGYIPGNKFIEQPNSRVPLFQASQTELSALDKHSIDLHAAALISRKFEIWAGKIPDALPVLFDGKLYRGNLLGDSPSILLKLLRNEVSTVSNPAPSKLLTKFSDDLEAVGNVIGIANLSALDRAAQSAMIAQSVEWYNFLPNGYSGQSFYTHSGGTLQYTTASAAGLTTLNKASLYTNSWLAQLTNQAGAVITQPIPQVYGQWNVSGLTGGNATAISLNKTQIFIGNAGSDVFTGGSKADTFLTGGGNDELDGGGGNDILRGGAGDDKYKFSGNFGKDVITDSDGQGAILWNGDVLGTARAAGRDTWVIKLGANKFVRLSVLDDKASTNGKKLVITDQDGVNTVTVNNFNLTAALGTGYLGIKLCPEQSVALIEGDAAKVGATPRWMSNVWSDSEFTESKLAGFSSNIAERTGAGFVVNLARAAEAGDTLTISTAGLDGTFKVILGDRTVAADGAVITLSEGDTTASFALISDGEISSDLSSASVDAANDFSYDYKVALLA
jgi:RTX calcium-binding nonapeptide repeat (4 copies)/Lipase (class 3)